MHGYRRKSILLVVKFPEQKPILHYIYQKRSRYGETDKMGHVYHGHYLDYFEVARTEMIRETGISYKELEDDGIMLPVIHAEIDFKSPIFYDELMDIHVYMFEEPAVRLKTYYKIQTSRSSAPHIIGEVTLCFIDSNTRKPVRAPEYILDAIRK